MKKNQVIKWALLTALVLWGTVSFLIVIGEESPTTPLPFVTFFFMKLGGMASLYFTARIGVRLHKFGLLPDLSKYITEE